MSIGQRIKLRLRELGMSGAELARRTELKQPTISDLINGKSRSSAYLHVIARELGTTPEYLAGESDEVAAGPLQDTRLPYRAPEKERTDLVELDQIDLRYGLGGTYVDGPVAAETRSFSRGWLLSITRAAPEHLFWAIGDGDSMEPTIRSGEVVLIDRSQLTPRMGEGIWALTWGDVGMIKRVRPLPDGTIELHSDNAHVRPIAAADGEVNIVGRVVAVVRRL
jgi:phage repressor protein C with HTH and peptisase S24 domain